MPDIINLIFQLSVLLLSVIIHELAHGFMALKLGDETAKRAGRLTLNPLKHLDPIGSIIFPLFFKIGWAKPVPYNPMFFTDQKFGTLKVAIVGPLSNLGIAILFGFLIRIGSASNILTSELSNLFLTIVFFNALLFIFNLVPIPPLDGSKVLAAVLPRHLGARIEHIGIEGIFIILIFVYFASGFIFGAASQICGALTGIGCF